MVLPTSRFFHRHLPGFFIKSSVRKELDSDYQNVQTGVKVMTTLRTQSEAPVTQSTTAVVSLLNYLGKSIDPLPDAVDLPGMALVLSNKKDVYYVTAANSCSCPSASYRPGQKCKHQRRHFPEIDAAKEAAGGDTGSILPSGKWPGGLNGPVNLETIKAKTEPNKAGA